jgi:hypothetical protein
MPTKMSHARKSLALALVALLALGALGCEDKLKRACSILRAGNHVLESSAFPAIDAVLEASGVLPPNWAIRYRLGRTALGAILTRLESACDRAAGDGLRFEDLAPTIAEAASLQSELIVLWRDARAAGEVPTVRDADGVDLEALLADLADLRAEASRAAR